jgi:hypothetical protein
MRTARSRAGRELLEAADLLIAVPLHWRRARPSLQPVQRDRAAERR